MEREEDHQTIQIIVKYGNTTPQNAAYYLQKHNGDMFASILEAIDDEEVVIKEPE